MKNYNYTKLRQIKAIFESCLTANLLKNACNNNVTAIYCTSGQFVLFLRKFSNRRNTLFAMSDKRKSRKILTQERKETKWKRKLAKSDKGSCYNQGNWINWINEHECKKKAIIMSIKMTKALAVNRRLDHIKSLHDMKLFI